MTGYLFICSAAGQIAVFLVHPTVGKITQPIPLIWPLPFCKNHLFNGLCFLQYMGKMKPTALERTIGLVSKEVKLVRMSLKKAMMASEVL